MPKKNIYGTRLIWQGDAAPLLPNNKHASCVYELWGFAYHKGVHQMLRMSGVAEQLITGNRSLFDKFKAIADATPYWIGHPYAYAMSQILLPPIGIPLIEETTQLAHLWLCEVKRLFITPQNTARFIAETSMPLEIYTLQSPSCRVHHQFENVCDITPFIFPSPIKTQEKDPQKIITQLSDNMISTLEECTDIIYRIDLTNLREFQRPHPYKAGLAYLKASQCEPLSNSEQAILSCQMLRVLGQYAKTHDIKIEFYNLHPEIYIPLVDYLSTCEADAEMVCVTDTPQDAICLARNGAKIRFSFDVCITHSQLIATLQTIAHGMPLGYLEGLDICIEGTLDILIAKRLLLWVDEWVKLETVDSD